MSTIKPFFLEIIFFPTSITPSVDCLIFWTRVQVGQYLNSFIKGAYISVRGIKLYCNMKSALNFCFRFVVFAPNIKRVKLMALLHWLVPILYLLQSKTNKIAKLFNQGEKRGPPVQIENLPCRQKLEDLFYIERWSFMKLMIYFDLLN